MMPGLDYFERRAIAAKQVAANRHQAAVARLLPLVAAKHLRAIADVQMADAPVRRSPLTADVELRLLPVR